MPLMQVQFILRTFTKLIKFVSTIMQCEEYFATMKNRFHDDTPLYQINSKLRLPLIKGGSLKLYKKK